MNHALAPIGVLLLAVVLAGCGGLAGSDPATTRPTASAPSGDTGPATTAPTAAPTTTAAASTATDAPASMTPTQPPACRLRIDVFDEPGDPYGDGADPFRYAENYSMANLSADAETLVERARGASDGTYTTQNMSLDAPAFEFSDVSAYYNVTTPETTLYVRTVGGLPVEPCEDAGSEAGN